MSLEPMVMPVTRLTQVFALGLLVWLVVGGVSMDTFGLLLVSLLALRGFAAAVRGRAWSRRHPSRWANGYRPQA